MKGKLRFTETGLHTTDFRLTVTKDDLELILLSPPPECWESNLGFPHARQTLRQ